jgi:hypothetical protein
MISNGGCRTSRPAGELAGYCTGVDLMRQAVGDKETYSWDDHAVVGLPMIVACTGCTTTMAGAAALIDPTGHTWCAECAELVNPAAFTRYIERSGGA